MTIAVVNVFKIVIVMTAVYLKQGLTKTEQQVSKGMIKLYIDQGLTSLKCRTYFFLT